jgi:hypothetical protein
VFAPGAFDVSGRRNPYDNRTNGGRIPACCRAGSSNPPAGRERRAAADHLAREVFLGAEIGLWVVGALSGRLRGLVGFVTLAFNNRVGSLSRR